MSGRLWCQLLEQNLLEALIAQHEATGRVDTEALLWYTRVKRNNEERKEVYSNDSANQYRSL